MQTGPRIASPAELTADDRKRLADCRKAGEGERRKALEGIVSSDPDLMRILRAVRDLGLPDCRLVSGAIYQTVWNVLTGRSSGYGIKDYDIIYFDGGDLSWQAEDAVIKRVTDSLPAYDGRIEVRNQARVHLWFEEKFGTPYGALSCTDEALTRYVAKTHAVGVRLEHNNTLDIIAPFGLAAIFGMKILPNEASVCAGSYREKADRMKDLWPELTIIDWPASASPGPL